MIDFTRRKKQLFSKYFVYFFVFITKQFEKNFDFVTNKFLAN